MLLHGYRTSRGLILVSLLLTFGGCAEDEVERLWGSGVLEAEQVLVSSTIGGRLLLRTVEEGDTVAEGDLIALVDTTAFIEARDLATVGLLGIAVERRQAVNILETARERLAQVIRNRDRTKVLVESDAATQSQLEDMESAVVLAGKQVEAAETSFEAFPVKEREIELRLASLKRQVSECSLTAPISGTILSVFAEPGEVIAPGRGVVTIADLERLYVRVYVPAPLVGRIRTGGDAQVTVDSFPDRTFSGRVVHIADEAEFTPRNVQTPEARADLVFAVKIAVANRDGLLKIGLPADVDLPEINR